MKSVVLLAALVIISATLAVGCRDEPAESPEVAVSNTLLESAVLDLLGDDTSVLRLTEPGSCPGHFDVRPSQATQLSKSRLLLRLDFQDSLDDKLSGATRAGLRIAEVHIDGGLCVPDSYLSACRQTADALVEAGLLDRESADERLEAIARRLDLLSARVEEKMGRLNGTPVVASVHQRAFCEWMGLRVVGTYRGADVEVPRRLQQAHDAGREAGAVVVIANRPEGRRAADFLAERLDGTVVVFDNFPVLGGRHGSFDDLVEDNVARFLEAAGQ